MSYFREITPYLYYKHRVVNAAYGEKCSLVFESYKTHKYTL
jgi:hypothetical protein